MIESEDSDGSESAVVSVTKHGQATIPKAYRERLGIDAPGKVRFRLTEDGDVVVEPVPSAADMRGFARREGDSSTDEAASALLREKRRRDRQERESRFEPDSEDGAE